MICLWNQLHLFFWQLDCLNIQNFQPCVGQWEEDSRDGALWAEGKSREAPQAFNPFPETDPLSGIPGRARQGTKRHEEALPTSPGKLSHKSCSPWRRRGGRGCQVLLCWARWAEEGFVRGCYQKQGQRLSRQGKAKSWSCVGSNYWRLRGAHRAWGEFWWIGGKVEKVEQPSSSTPFCFFRPLCSLLKTLLPVLESSNHGNHGWRHTSQMCPLNMEDKYKCF